MQINNNYANLKDSYLFKTITQKVNAYKTANPDANIIRLGIGDVTRPLVPAVVTAMHVAVDEMGQKESFSGYDDGGVGYPFLREAIAGYYAGYGVAVDPEEIIVGDGSKSDISNILDLFSPDARVLIPDPVYPVYVDTNIMAGRKITFMNGTAQNGFLPLPDDLENAENLSEPGFTPDIIYICSPNNPTGAVYSREQLKKWVDFAKKSGAVLFFDAAYETFVQTPGLPRSIFEIEGARTCAIEFCSFSKLAGFTGVRCGYTVVPKELSFNGQALHAWWRRRQTTKFNGVSYITQRGAAAVFSPEGFSQIKENIGYYLENAKIISATLKELGIRFTGGENAPYIWLRCPGGMGSWEYFETLLEKANVVGTPGAGFGQNGEGYFRLTAFGERENIEEAMGRITNL
ncbi:MAG: LL-diaminopimelate aminotransferase [Oscillospiraceae bacterium]|jgi:LL-diaminopimelate aminotransferase|nr:LL-diaminopimelate aminotransferase [Oscillospiraceae bacterium]